MTTYTSQYPPVQNDTYVKATSKYSTYYWPYYATDPAKSVTGVWSANGWVSANGSPSNQKFNIDLGSAIQITRVYVENAHYSGTQTNAGIRDVLLYGTNDAAAFANLTYSDTTSLTLIGSFTVARHPDADIADPQYFVISNDAEYRYYVLRIANNYGNTGFMAVRRIELQTQLVGEGSLSLQPVEVQAIAPFGSLSLQPVEVSAAGGGAGSLSVQPLEISGAGGGAGLISLQPLEISGTGETSTLAYISGTLFSIGGGIEANSETACSIGGSLFTLYGGFDIDRVDVSGELFSIGGTIACNTVHDAVLSGTLFSIGGTIAAESGTPLALAGSLFELGGGFTIAEAGQSNVVSGTLFSVYGSMAAYSEAQAEVEGELFQLGGGFNIDAAGCTGVLTYSRGTVV